MRLPEFCCTTLVRFRLTPLGQTLPRSKGWRRSKFQPLLTVVVVQIHTVGRFLATRLAHRWREEDHRRKHDRPSPDGHSPRWQPSLCLTRASDCCVCATFPHFGQVQSSAMLMDGACLDATRSRHPPDVARKVVRGSCRGSTATRRRPRGEWTQLSTWT